MKYKCLQNHLLYLKLNSMSGNTYTIGIDYGTLSGRAVPVNTRNGEIVTSSALAYPHAVMDTTLPDCTSLCFDEKFKSEPNLWVKLWKHHAAQDKADALNRIAAERGEKNAFIMQIYADMIGLPVHISASSQAPALGSAIFAAIAAGKSVGGYDNLSDAVKAMVTLPTVVYQPRESAVKIYQKLN